MSAIFDAFLDGCTGRGLFIRLRRPGSPAQLFADEQSDQPQPGLVKALLHRKVEQDKVPLSDDLLAALPVGFREITASKRAGSYLKDRNPAADILTCLRDQFGRERTATIVEHALTEQGSILRTFLTSHFGAEDAGVILHEARRLSGETEGIAANGSAMHALAK